MTENGYHHAFVRLRSHTTGEWFVHPDLRARMVADAEAQGISLSEVAVKILADRYRVACAQTGRRTSPKADALVMGFRIPTALYTALATAAAREGVGYQDVIRADFCAHYGLSMPAAAAA